MPLRSPLLPSRPLDLPRTAPPPIVTRAAAAGAARGSLAWPGADPACYAGSTAEQLDLFVAHGWRVLAGSGDTPTLPVFDPTPFQVVRLQGAGTMPLVEAFLQRWHYEQAPGMRGPMFGLYYHGPGAPELVGLCTFARVSHPAWGALTFPAPATLPTRLPGMPALDPADALRHAGVAESEYLELNRLALADPSATRAPLGRGASSWFVARCLQYFEHRNHALWRAQTAVERGQLLSPAQVRLLESARLDDPAKGLGFLKSVVSFADVWQGHAGYTYMALGFHYAGQSPADGAWSAGHSGTRSGQRLSRRTLQKARAAHERGHDTAVLRLLWEGGTGTVRVWVGGRCVAEDDGAWIRTADAADQPPERAIEQAWREYRRVATQRFGADCTFTTTYTGGGVTPGRFPPKRRFLLCLGADYWRHHVERRCVYLRERLAARDAAWIFTNWGPLPDTRALFYPGAVPLDEVNPALRADLPDDAIAAGRTARDAA